MGFEGISVSTNNITLLEAFNGFVGLNLQYDFGYLVRVKDSNGNINVNFSASSSQTSDSQADENGVAYLNLNNTDTITIKAGTISQDFSFDINTKSPGIIELEFEPPSLIG